MKIAQKGRIDLFNLPFPIGFQIRLRVWWYLFCKLFGSGFPGSISTIYQIMCEQTLKHLSPESQKIFSTTISVQRGRPPGPVKIVGRSILYQILTRSILPLPTWSGRIGISVPKKIEFEKDEIKILEARGVSEAKFRLAVAELNTIIVSDYLLEFTTWLDKRNRECWGHELVYIPTKRRSYYDRLKALAENPVTPL